MHWLPCGTYNVNYRQDFAIFRTKPHWISLIVFLIILFTLPFYTGRYILTLLSTIGITIIAVQGLGILTGYAGQISIGQAAFVGTGAYISVILMQRFDFPFLPSLLFAGIGSGLIGILFGLPALRIKGFYLAMSTLAAQVILGWFFLHLRSITGGTEGLHVEYASIPGIIFNTPQSKYWLIMVCTLLTIFFVKNLMRTRVGRALVAVRDNDLAAEVMGIEVMRYKLLAFFLSCFFAGIAGSLFAHYIGFINPVQFTLQDSILYLGILIVGGMGSIMGAIFGTIFMKLIEEFAFAISPALTMWFPAFGAQFFAALSLAFYAIIIILFLIFEPRGINHLWVVLKNRYRLYPFSY
ncbi:MAG: branched-chain amino acid ABC transporter permease [Deltaproteobacteria bacterium]|nr:branched-chain amino acid ABC transporter permease [Deltaproteobacteria bacterium]MBW2008197.1 branched-chain amino acid ABC transporter permease [Deltaproteobacteria bacterium]MBW2349031.1 branched-chain amino acid ABC transporter permease [Deltaproteobacteria bacterium]